VRSGDRVTLVTDLGQTTFGVAGVFVDYTSDAGTLLMDRKQYQRFWNDSLVDAYDLWLARGGDSGRVAEEIREKLGGRYELFVSTHVQIKERILRLMRDSFRVNYALESVAILVAVMGLVQNLLASAVDRTRQFGVLRALGAQKRDLRASLMLEAGLIGLAGGLLGVVGGALISFHHVVYNTKTLTGWSFSYVFPWSWGLGIVLGTVLVSGLVGVWIGARVARQSITSSIQYE
jgi:putative ABC transport system permease protein